MAIPKKRKIQINMKEDVRMSKLMFVQEDFVGQPLRP